ncbi:unnamed protein product [Acanthoscelides obtectus]|uniref:Uncharacterized protein n=1 Tax=Acanthoscelides obtectus TaxID=200917 RepID=A0A9P0P4Y6_ACAOB|nr:unnamed protein product [Acanthoscelides obtectus]CAK1645423.1 hypothetical protein AOBTE_LOCUS14109 [Acanthoscelides obtectus]
MLPYGAPGPGPRDPMGYASASDMSGASGSRGQEPPPMVNQWYPPQRQAYNFLIDTPPRLVFGSLVA